MEQFLEKLESALRSTILMLNAHPHNEPDSEFADRINALEELQTQLKDIKVEQSKPKSIFQKMHILNQMDAKNKTAHCGVFNELVSANMVKAGGHVTMGVDRGTFMEITLDPEKRAVLLIAIDREQFDAIK